MKKLLISMLLPLLALAACSGALPESTSELLPTLESAVVDVAGTFPVLATCLDRFLADTRFGMLQPLAGPISDDHWYPMMYISGGGLTHRWFRDQFASDELKQAEAEGVSPYCLKSSIFSSWFSSFHERLVPADPSFPLPKERE